MSINDLPKELVTPICKILGDVSPRALSALSMTNSWFYNIGAEVLYATVSIRFSDIHELTEITESISETGLGRPFLKHARRVEIMFYPGRTLPVPSGRQVWRTKHYGYPYTSRSLQHHIYYCTRNIERSVGRWTLPWSRASPSYSDGGVGEPLVSLFQRLPRIEELSYAAVNPFPVSLLNAIEIHHPSCRISVWSSHFSNLELNMVVATSPRLHAITVHYPIEFGVKKFGIGLRLVSLVTMAPNLEHLYIYTDLESTAQNNASVVRPPIACEPRLKLQTFSISSIPRLYGPSASQSAIQHAFRDWANSIELAFIRTLVLANERYPSMLREVAADLKSLERLVICVESDGRPQESTTEELRYIFQCLNPLKHLTIQGLEDISLMHDILGRHGPHLEGLLFEPYLSGRTWLYPIIDHLQIQRLVDACPILKVLRVPIRRSKWDFAEVLTYRALGSFSQISYLILDLYGNPRPVSQDGEHYVDSRANFTTGLGTGIPVTARNILNNFTIDRTLAAAIWKEISSHQGSRCLSMLRIVPWGGEALDRNRIYTLLQLSRSFLVKNNGKEVVEI